MPHRGSNVIDNLNFYEISGTFDFVLFEQLGFCVRVEFLFQIKIISKNQFKIFTLWSLPVLSHESLAFCMHASLENWKYHFSNLKYFEQDSCYLWP